MAGKILVALNRLERAEEITPYLENLARSGTKVIFLFRYPIEFGPYLRDYWMESESAKKIMLAGRKLIDSYSWEAQKARAEEKIAATCKVLREKEIVFEAELYTGSLKTRLREHTRAGNVEWIIMPARASLWLARLMAGGAALFGWFRWDRSFPIMLLSPKCIAETNGASHT
jgi:nucleotide-binding universal stress UspA family protein